MILHASRPLYSLEELVKKEIHKTPTFFPNGYTPVTKVVMTIVVVGLQGLAAWIFHNRATSGNIPEQYVVPTELVPNQQGTRPHLLFRAQKIQRQLMGLPQQSSYMLDIKDFERDPSYEFKGDFPKQWWTCG